MRQDKKYPLLRNVWIFGKVRCLPLPRGATLRVSQASHSNYNPSERYNSVTPYALFLCIPF